MGGDLNGSHRAKYHYMQIDQKKGCVSEIHDRDSQKDRQIDRQLDRQIDSMIDRLVRYMIQEIQMSASIQGKYR